MIDDTSLVVDGLISADGEGTGCGAPGSGSEGGININTAMFSGTGVIQTRGGIGEVGGRVTISYTDTESDTFNGGFNITGGTGGGGGQSGTVYVIKK